MIDQLVYEWVGVVGGFFFVNGLLVSLLVSRVFDKPVINVMISVFAVLTIFQFIAVWYLDPPFRWVILVYFFVFNFGGEFAVMLIHGYSDDVLEMFVLGYPFLWVISLTFSEIFGFTIPYELFVVYVGGIAVLAYYVGRVVHYKLTIV